MSSFQYARSFIDAQAKVLSQPFQAKDFERFTSDELPAKKLQQVLEKVNSRIRQHNRQLFKSQVIEQVAQQVCKNEHKRVMIVNETLSRLSLILIPIEIPSLLAKQKLSRLIRKLPESKYLFSLEDGLEDRDYEDNDDTDSNVEQVGETDGIIREFGATANDSAEDDKYRPKRQKRAQRELKQRLMHSLRKSGNTEQLLEQYRQVRDRLLLLDQDMRYKSEKLAYLKNLDQTINGAFPRDFKKVSVDGMLYDSDEEHDHRLEVEQTKLFVGNSATAGSEELNKQLGRFSQLVDKVSQQI